MPHRSPPQTRAAAPVPTSPWHEAARKAAVGVATFLLWSASASAVVVDAASLPNGTLLGSTNFQGLSFGSAATNWYAFSYASSGPVFVLGSGSTNSASGAHSFIRASEAIQLNSIRVAWVGGNDTVDGWFDLYNDDTRVFSGDKGLKNEPLYDANLAFTVSTTIRAVDVRPMQQDAGASMAYNRVVLVFRQANNPPNYAAIQSFDIQALQSANTLLGTPVVAVPEPDSVALLLAGLGTVGWVSGRRRNVA